MKHTTRSKKPHNTTNTLTDQELWNIIHHSDDMDMRALARKRLILRGSVIWG